MEKGIPLSYRGLLRASSAVLTGTNPAVRWRRSNPAPRRPLRRWPRRERTIQGAAALIQAERGDFAVVLLLRRQTLYVRILVFEGVLARIGPGGIVEPHTAGIGVFEPDGR